MTPTIVLLFAASLLAGIATYAIEFLICRKQCLERQTGKEHELLTTGM